VITNIVLALLSLLVLRGAPDWIRHVIFWGVNLGLVVFVIGLILDTAEIKRIGAPVMGVTLLVALAFLAWRAFSAPPDTAELETA
jgi:Zn-dependent membrane protease YugP